MLTFKLWVTGIVAAIVGYLGLRLNHEKERRKAAEIEKETLEANVDVLVRDKKIVAEIEVLREDDDEKRESMLNEQKIQLEKIKYETSDAEFISGITRVLNDKDDNQV